MTMNVDKAAVEEYETAHKALNLARVAFAKAESDLISAQRRLDKASRTLFDSTFIREPGTVANAP